jgi:hypothetical protein
MLSKLAVAVGVAVALAVAVTWGQMKSLKCLPCFQHCWTMFYMGGVNQKTQ